MEPDYPKGREDKSGAVRLPKGLIEEIERFLKTDTARNMGFHYKIDVVSEAVRDLLRKYQLVPRFVHVNTYEDHAVIRDNKVGRDVTIYFRNGGVAYCDYCDSKDCEHIDYALSLPEVTEPLERRGWKSK